MLNRLFTISLRVVRIGDLLVLGISMMIQKRPMLVPRRRVRWRGRNQIKCGVSILGGRVGVHSDARLGGGKRLTRVRFPS